MQQTVPSAHQQFRILKIVYTALPVMVALFGIAVLVINYVTPAANIDQPEIWYYAAPALLVFSIPASSLLFNNITQGIKGADVPLNRKLATYQTAVIVKAALLEAPALLACIAAFLTGRIVILLVIPLVLLLFFINRPTLYRLESDLELTRDEVDQLKGSHY